MAFVVVQRGFGVTSGRTHVLVHLSIYQFRYAADWVACVESVSSSWFEHDIVQAKRSAGVGYGLQRNAIPLIESDWGLESAMSANKTVSIYLRVSVRERTSKWK